jgi:hypothetical protein
MVEFYHVVTDPEVRSAYLNLTDDQGERHGEIFPSHRTRLAILDGQEHLTFAQKHGKNQLWGTLDHWYRANHIQASTGILVRYDPQEAQREGCPVVHLIPEAATSQAVQPLLRGSPEPSAHTEFPISLERQLEDFLVQNLSQLEAGLTLFVDEDGRHGRQYLTDVGRIDLLCRRANGDLLVVELKQGGSSDTVVGQISRYIGWVKQYLAGNRRVFGLVLTHDQDEYLKYAVLANERLMLRYFRLKLDLISEDELAAYGGAQKGREGK